MRASEVEARFQLDKWGTDGEPVAFGGQSDDCFAALIYYLADKALNTTPDEGQDKKLHRITTIAAAAANWHMLAARECGSVVDPTSLRYSRSTP